LFAIYVTFFEMFTRY